MNGADVGMMLAFARSVPGTAAQAAVAAQTAAEAAAGTAQEVLESIPQDYTTLSNDVDDLKSAVTNAEGDIDALQTAVPGKVNKPVSSPNGTSGQLLRTNGDGTTTWVDQGLPTDAQTAEAVSDWLDDHPEATTTVQDGSITSMKFQSILLEKPCICMSIVWNFRQMQIRHPLITLILTVKKRVILQT